MSDTFRVMSDSTRTDSRASRIQQRLRVARLTLELVPGADWLAAEQVELAARQFESWKAGEPEPSADAAPAGRTELLARAAELERALRDEAARRLPAGTNAWRGWVRKWWWAVLAAVALATYVGLSVRHRSFRPSDWSKAIISGMRIDSSNQTYASLMVGTKRRGVPVFLGGRKVGPSLFVHAVSEVNVTVLDEGAKLSGTCGYPDDLVGNAVVCTVRDGDRVLFESPTLDETHHEAKFQVAIPPTRKLKLEWKTTKDNIRFAQGVWTDFKVTR